MHNTFYTTLFKFLLLLPIGHNLNGKAMIDCEFTPFHITRKEIHVLKFIQKRNKQMQYSSDTDILLSLEVSVHIQIN